RLDGYHVRAVYQQLLHVERLDLFPVVALADLLAVDPDGEGVGGGEVEDGFVHGLLHGAVDAEGEAEVARARRGGFGLIEPDPLGAAGPLGVDARGRTEPAEGQHRQPEGRDDQGTFHGEGPWSKGGCG